jgi:hypothetical protein
LKSHLDFGVNYPILTISSRNPLTSRYLVIPRCLRGLRLCSREEPGTLTHGALFSLVCVFITAGPSTKLFAWGGEGYWGTGATRDDEPRPVWTSLVPLVWESNPKLQGGWVKRVFITNVKGTFLGMSESEEASKRR